MKENEQVTELVNLYHTARIALSDRPHGRWERMQWACDEYCKAHPEARRKRVYLALDRALN